MLATKGPIFQKESASVVGNFNSTPKSSMTFLIYPHIEYKMFRTKIWKLVE